MVFIISTLHSMISLQRCVYNHFEVADMSKLNSLPVWRRNLIVLWFGVFMTGLGMSEIMPFLSLFIDQLGHYNKPELTVYSSIVFSVSFLMMALVSPIWGRMADRKGRKLMLLRASLGMGIVFFLMGFVTNVWQLMFLRALQGAFGGYVSNSNALIATQTPREHAGQSLSILVTGMTAGTLLGPLLGGALASVFSYRMSFHITGIIMLTVFVLTYFFVKETFVAPKPSKDGQLPAKKTFKDVTQNKLILILFITTMAVQIVNMSINPILSLYVRQLNANPATITFVAGLVAAMPGISTVLAAPRFGRLGDQIGSHKVLIFGFSFAAIIFLLTSLTQNIPELMILRFLTGISDAAMLPSVQTLLTRNTKTSETSIVFSYNQSFQSIGAVLGPLLGALLANIFNYSGIFVAGTLIMLFNLALFTYIRKRNQSLNQLS
nr:MFS transporter [Periweissella fabaria]